MTEALNASAAKIAALQGELGSLKQTIAELRDSLAYARNPQLTPYGIFLRYPEAEEMTIFGKLTVNKVLEEFPVVLYPGEGADIVEIMSEHNVPGKNYYDHLVPYLGATRVRTQLSQKELKKLSLHIFEDRWARLGLGDYPG